MRFGGTGGSAERGRRAGAALLGVTVAAGTGFAAGCASDATTAAGGGSVSLAVSPAGGAGEQRPDAPVAVKAERGTIANVTVTREAGTAKTAEGGADGDSDGNAARSGAKAVEGSLNAARTQWRSRWTLAPGTAYTVHATAIGLDGRTRTVSTRFTTAKAEKELATQLEAPYDKETVGVGMPIILRFKREITDKAAVERALEVRSSKPVEGAWHWFDEDYPGPSVVFRPKEYWPAHTDVTLNAHLAGVQGAKGVYGTKDQSLRFRVGDSRISTASENSHQMVVKKNGKVVRKMPVSMGKGGVRKYTTTNGVHLTMDKGSPVTMTSGWEGIGPGSPGYYSLTVYNAVRISNSGEYVHSAPWSVGSQGSANVSHGCINMSPSNAKWFYNFSHRGDPYEVTGSDRELEPTNGWGYWQLSWRDWVKGSALKQGFKIGPSGSVPLPAA
ncbi:Ig-like domain-containing protein [Actinomadura sp. 21ATH]|uniref:L,D-transpeptidase n=1 Tax=Actinomadura sp. 21ATH TaxID=1735444 RepID=UPI0035C069C5